MTTYEYFLTVNASNYHKTAACIRLDNGGERSYTYGQMFASADIFAEALKRAGVQPGDRVAIAAESCPEWCIAYLAAAKIKATAVLLDISLEKGELSRLLEKAKVRCIFTTKKTLEKLNTFVNIPILDILNNADFIDGYDCRICSEKSTDGNENISTILFSSGTTKTASGIMHSHESLINTTKMTIDCNKLDSDERFLAVIPNSHIYGLICQVIGAFSLGANLCYLENLNADSLNSAFRDYHPTILPAIPKMYELFKTQILRKINSEPKTQKLFASIFPLCLALRKKTGINMGKVFFKTIHKGFGSKIKVFCSAGAPLGSETADFYYGTGFNIEITYGATETNIPTIGNYGSKLTTDTCGRAYPDVSLKLGGDGEILIKSPYMMLGYFDDEASTCEAYDEEGWFKTGDLGCIDEKGYIKILGRCKDNIVLATGKKVAPDDIENAYSNISGIMELVICGIPVSDGSYDEIHAFAIIDPSKSETALQGLKDRSASLPQTMKLADIHVLDSIPKTSLLKPKRYLLKQMTEQRNKSTDVLPSVQTADIAMVIKEAVAKAANIDISEVLPGTKPFLELAIDSLGSIELCCEIEEKCGINADIACFIHKNMTVSDLIECASTPYESIKPSFAQRYPMKKNLSDYNIFLFIQYLLHRIYNIKVENESVLPESDGYIICSNHVSNFDYLFLTLNFKWERFSKFCCMAKKELFNKIPTSRQIAKIAGMVPVDRGGFVNDSFAVVCGKLKESWGILIHPEGTRSETGEISTFKRGAALLSIEANVPIIPACIVGGYEIFPRSKKLPSLFNWKNMKRHRVEVKYGNPIFPKGLSADELIKLVESEVRRLKNSTEVASI